jgi:hypothetical protein
MAFTKSAKPRRSGLDDGVVKSKKQKKLELQQQKDAEDTTEVSNADKPSAQQKPAKETPILKIQPGESMTQFRARVDAALPLSGISKSSKKIAGVSDHRVTKHERKLKRLQKGWREEEARIRDKEMEERELAEEEDDEQAAMWEDKNSSPPPTSTRKQKASKKNKRKLVAGEVDNNSEDEFAALTRTREQRKGLHDVVSAPPTFTKVPREIFKVREGAGAKVGNVPGRVGSLRKREEVAEVRRGVIEEYRRVVAGRKEGRKET